MSEPGSGARRGRLISTGVWVLVAAWLGFALLRLLGLERGYPLVPLVAFTPYLAAGSLIPLTAALLLRRWVAAAVAAIVAAVLVALVIPRAFGGGGPEVADGIALRVLTANLEYGRGDPQALATLVEELEVDLLSVQELTPAAAAPLRRALAERLPEQMLLPRTDAGGGGLFSDRPLARGSQPTLLPGGFSLPSATIAMLGASPVEIVGVHAVPPISGATGSWADDLERLPDSGPEPLRVLAGDFNATLDHAKLRELLDRGYTDAADAAGAGLATTWPVGRFFPPEVTIDHVLADARIGIGDASVHEIPGSDHRAVFAELLVPRDSGRTANR